VYCDITLNMLKLQVVDNKFLDDKFDCYVSSSKQKYIMDRTEEMTEKIAIFPEHRIKMLSG